MRKRRPTKARPMQTRASRPMMRFNIDEVKKPFEAVDDESLSIESREINWRRLSMLVDVEGMW